jgi:hypothetical protein
MDRFLSDLLPQVAGPVPKLDGKPLKRLANIRFDSLSARL